MRKNVIIYAIAFVLFALSFLSFNRAYKEMRLYSVLTNRSVMVASDFQELSRQINNAAVIDPDHLKRMDIGSYSLFFTDSLSLCRKLDSLSGHVVDSVNVRLAKQLRSLVRSELPWLLHSKVSDSIIQHTAISHITALKRIDSLIKTGINRTRFLFRYREEKLQASVSNVKIKILTFLGLASALLIYTTAELYVQYAKRRRKEKELERHERRFRAMVEHNQDLIVIMNESVEVLYRSPSAERITGFTNEEQKKNYDLDELHPEDRKKIQEYLSEMKQNPGKVIPVSYRIKHKLGHYIWLEGTFASLFHDPDLKGIVVNVKDVSERKAAEQELRKSEARFRQTLENMMEGVQIIGFDWHYIYVNDALTMYSGYQREQMTGRSIMDVYPGVEQTILYATLQRCMQLRTTERLESEFVFPDGSRRYFDLSIQPVPEGIFILSVDISERKKAEEELQKNIKELTDYKYAIDESSIVAITDQKGIIRHVNDNFCKISGYNRQDLLGQDHRLINSGYHPKAFIRELWTTIANGNIWKGELKNRASDGSAYWVDTTIIPFLNATGKPYQYLAIRNDITERKKAEEEIIKLNRLYAFISAINQSIVHITDENALLKKACSIAIETGGFRLARIEMLGENGKLNTVSIRGASEDTWQAMEAAGKDHNLSVSEATTVGRTLRSRTYEVNNDMLNDPALSEIREDLIRIGIRSGMSLPVTRMGKMIGIFTLSSSQPDFFDRREIDLLLEAAGDISFALENFEKTRLHKITEEQVIYNERRFRALIEKSTDLKTLTSSDGMFVYASPSVSTIFGYTEAEFLNKPVYEFFHPEDLPDLLKKSAAIMDRPGASFNFQYRARHKNGTWIWSEGTLTNMLHEPAIKALVSNFKDISEKKNAEAQKEFDRNNLDALINNTHDLLWSLDREFRLITFNQPFCDAVRTVTGRELRKGDNIFSVLLSQQQEEQFRRLYSRALSGEVFTDVIENELGSAAEISFFPICRGHEIIGTACYSRDISQRLHAEKEREKMIADLVRYSKNLEQFAYVVSHNLRSPVANIMGLANVLKSNISKEDKERSREFLYKAVEQLDVTVKDLNKILEVRSAAGQSREEVCLTEILEGIKLSIADTIQSEQVRFETDLNVKSVHTIKSYLHSVLYNLITNSIKYRRREVTPLIRIHTSVKDDKLLIVFSDNGTGMNLEQYGSRVFGLYQRFHLSISGKGMGLFMVKTQVETMEGNISLKSSPGKGTEFTIELPAVS